MQHGILTKHSYGCGRDECLSGLLIAAAGGSESGYWTALCPACFARSRRGRNNSPKLTFQKSLEADMFNSITKLRFTLAVLVIAALKIAIYKAGSTQASATAGTQSVIVQLRDDPAAVYKAKIQKAGGSVSDEQLQAYRDGLRTSQDQFLADLKNQGVNFSLDSVDIKGFDGNTAATVQYRYTLVLNAVALTVPQSAISILQSRPQVKSVEPNRTFHVSLSRSVDYIDAPRLYGSNPNDLTPFASFPDGNEGQGVYVAVIDTGIDWTHAMLAATQLRRVSALVRRLP